MGKPDTDSGSYPRPFPASGDGREESANPIEVVPSCPPAHCAERAVVEERRAICEKSPLYTAVYQTGCYNRLTGEWRFWAPKEALMRCNQLGREQPAWTFAGCNCHCLEECEEVLDSHGLTPVCPPGLCASFAQSEIYKQACAQMPLNAPVQAIGCYNVKTGQWRFAEPSKVLQLCGELTETDPNWQASSCYCCCTCSAGQTAIGLPDGQWRPIGEIGPGDTVLAGSVGESGALEWAPATVGFSQGIDDSEATVHLAYGDAQQMIVAGDLPLLLADGLLSTASRLVPGTDRLMGSDGEAVDIAFAGWVSNRSGIHHIATDAPWVGSMDGHLIQSGGVVAGDFVLQLHLTELEQKQLSAGWSALPQIGTPEYEDANPQLRTLEHPDAYLAP